MIAQKISVYKT